MKLIFGSPSDLDLSKDSVVSFYRDNWPKRTPLSDQRFYDYLYRDESIQGTNPEATMLAFDSNSGEILGVMAARKSDFFLKSGSRLNGVEMSTWLVRDDYKSSGIGVKILLEIKKRYDICVGASVTQEARNIYLKLGFSYKPALPRFIFSPDWTLLDSYVSDSHFISKIALSRKVHNIQPASYKTINFKDIPDKFDRLQASGFNRSKSHLMWRYQKNPFFDYKVISIRRNGFEIIVVYRIECFDHFTALRVLDILGDWEIASLVPFQLEELCKETGALFVDFFCSHHLFYDLFILDGWFSVPEESLFVDLPHLLSPVALTSPNTYSFIYWIKPSLRADFKPSELYLTKQDCDMDRLSRI